MNTAGAHSRNAIRSHTTQMNVRIDADLKKRGDRAFARVGYSPSAIVRALWGYADRHANDPEALRHMAQKLSDEAESEAAASIDAQQAALEEGWALVDNFRRDHGLVCPIPDDDDERTAYYDQLREEAYWERLAERGLA